MTKKNPASSRVHRDTGVPDDAFVGTVRRLIDWGQDNRGQVMVGVVAIGLLALAAVWFVSQQRSLEATAAQRLGQVQQSVASGNAQLAIRDLQSFLETFGSTSTADQARLVLADLLINQDRPAEAVQALGDLPNRLDDPFGIGAARLQAAALEAQGSLDQAVAAYRRIGTNARFTFERREALADAARIRLQNGDPAAAVELYRQLLDTFDDSEAGRGYYEMRMAEARALTRAG